MRHPATADVENLRPELRDLARRLAELTTSDLDLVVAAARRGGHSRAIPWATLRAAQGVANAGGGDAIADSAKLYDDC